MAAEKYIEQMLVDRVKKRGGLCPKWVSPGTDGMPDRIVLIPGGRIGFVEVKAPGKKPRKIQKHRLEQLRRMGFQAFVLDDPEQIDEIISQVEGGDIK